MKQTWHRHTLGATLQRQKAKLQLRQSQTESAKSILAQRSQDRQCLMESVRRGREKWTAPSFDETVKAVREMESIREHWVQSIREHWVQEQYKIKMQELEYEARIQMEEERLAEAKAAAERWRKEQFSPTFSLDELEEAQRIIKDLS